MKMYKGMILKSVINTEKGQKKKRCRRKYKNKEIVRG